MKKLNEKKYMAAVKTIAESLVIMATEDAEDDTAWRPDFEEVLDDYTGDFYEQLKQAIHDLQKEEKK